METRAARRLTILAVEYSPPWPKSGCAPHGMGLGPQALLDAGLEAALERAGLPVSRVVRERSFSDSEDPRRALPVIAGRVATAVREALAVGSFPLILGDCTATVGGLAGLAAACGGDAVLLWHDAHADLNTPETSPSGYFGGMPLATIVGRGARWWREGAGSGLPLPDERVALIGTRDLDPGEREILSEGRMTIFDPSSLRDPPRRRDTLAAIESFVRRGRGLYFHVDVDVLDPEFSPSVYFPLAGGLTPEDLHDLAAAAVSGLAAGASAGRRPVGPVCLAATAFDPLADPSQASATATRLAGWVAGLAKTLAGAAFRQARGTLRRR